MDFPNVYVFNPTCEMAVLNGSVSYMPPARLSLFECNLSAMLMWLAGSSDIILVDNPSVLSLQPLFGQLGIVFPKVLTFDELERSNFPLGEFRPWGRSPEIYHRFKSLKHRFKTPIAEWQPNDRLFFSRYTNQRLVDALMPLIIPIGYICIPAKPIEAKTLAEVYRAIDTFAGKAVVKTPWSSSGRGIAMVDKSNNRVVDERWLLGALKQQGALLVEPFLIKIIDLSFHFWLYADGSIDYLGHNFFSTDSGGKFTGCYLDADPSDEVIGVGNSQVKTLLNEGSTVLHQALLSMKLNANYTGPIGVDAMLYKADDGLVVLHPAIEINLRYTMGYVNLQMRKRLGNDVKGRWEIAQFTDGEWPRFCVAGEAQNPFIVENGKAVKGFLPLLPHNSLFGAWMEFG